MGGQIRRGHTETMNAAIWLSDLRGFTALSDRLPAETVVDILNHYFDCQVAAIRKHGGEVLKYMGDGLLAVFPIDEYVGDDQAGLLARAGSRPRIPRQRRGDAISDRRHRRALSLRRRAACRANSVRQYRRRQPARLHLHRSRRQSRRAAGEDRRPAAAAPWWRPKALPAICRGGWSDLGEFPIAGFSKAERVYGLIEETAQRAEARSSEEHREAMRLVGRMR